MDNLDKLVQEFSEATGIQPGGASVTQDILREVAQEIHQAEVDKARAKAKTSMEEFLKVVREWKEHRKEVQKTEAKFEKAAAKVLKRIKEAAKGSDVSLDDDDAPDGGSVTTETPEGRG